MAAIGTEFRTILFVSSLATFFLCHDQPLPPLPAFPSSAIGWLTRPMTTPAQPVLEINILALLVSLPPSSSNYRFSFCYFEEISFLRPSLCLL